MQKKLFTFAATRIFDAERGFDPSCSTATSRSWRSGETGLQGSLPNSISNTLLKVKFEVMST